MGPRDTSRIAIKVDVCIYVTVPPKTVPKIIPLQVQDVTVVLGEASALRHAFVSTPRKTHCWKLEKSAYEKKQSSTVTRELFRLLI